MLSLHRRTAELVTAFALLALVVLLLVMASQLPPSPVRSYPGAAFFPMIALGGTGLFVLAWIAGAFRRHAPAPAVPAAPADPAGEAAGDGTRVDFELRDYLVTIAATLAFIYGMDVVGFELAGFLVLSALLWTRMSSPIAALATAAITTLVLYGTFVLLLNVSMPLLFLPRFLSF